MTHQLLAWEDRLSTAGCRVTRQRGIILDAVCAGGGHTPLSEIFGRVRKADPSIDRSTLYRTLKVFVELGIVVVADTGAAETYYEIARPIPHHHLVCRSCGREQEIDQETVDSMVDRVRHRHRFRVETDHLVLFGHCERCAPISETRNPPGALIGGGFH